jgi:hypothetical protein
VSAEGIHFVQSEIPRSIPSGSEDSCEEIHGPKKRAEENFSVVPRRLLSGDTVRNWLSAAGQAPAKRSLKDGCHGEALTDSVRIAVNERPSPDEFGLTFTY